MAQPLLSIITVTYNPSLEKIKKTIDSVQAQTMRHQIEHILIDGQSQDGTVEALKKKELIVDFWLSEADTGIYEAMNKGVRFAKGSWVLFLNAGDILVDKALVEKLAPNLQAENYGVIYGDCIVDYGFCSFYEQALPLSSLPWGMIASHQSFIVKRDLLVKYPFNFRYKVCADYDFICKIKAETRFKRIALAFAKVEAEGFSSKRHGLNIKEKKAIALRYFPNVYFLNYYYLIKYYYLAISRKIEKILPVSILFLLRSQKYAFKNKNKRF